MTRSIELRLLELESKLQTLEGKDAIRTMWRSQLSGGDTQSSLSIQGHNHRPANSNIVL